MKLFNHKLELTAIKSICDSPRKYQNRILSALQDEHFYSPPAVETRKRITHLVRSSGEIPSYTELCTDPVISEDTRKILTKFEVEPVSTTKRMQRLIEQAHKYFQMRKLYFLSERINEDLLKDKVDVDDLLERASDEVTKARVKSDGNQPIYHLGVGNNSTAIIKKMLDDSKVEYIPTGFKAFDERNGGLFMGSLVTLGGTSGGGKCLTFSTYLTIVDSVKVRFKDGSLKEYIPEEWSKIADSEEIESIEYITHDVQIGELWENSGGYKFNGVSDEKMCNVFIQSKDGPLKANRVFRTFGKTEVIKFSSGRILEGLGEHRLMNAIGEWVFIRDLRIGDRITSVEGFDTVVSKTIGSEQYVYDINVPVYHHYYANGLVSHNSSLALNLLKNMAENAESVAYVPLEMTEDETYARLMSNMSKVPISKILQKKLASGEKKAIKKSYSKFVADLKEKGNRFTVFSPEEDMTAEEILLMLKPYNFKVVLIDYISLLKGVDGDDAWQQLGKVARMCKIYAKNNNMIIIILVQINKEGEVRYSKAIVEHSNNALFFVATDETRDAGILNIKQVKARNQAMFDFQLSFEPETMTITDIDGSVNYSRPEPSDTKDHKRKKSRDKSNHHGPKNRRYGGSGSDTEDNDGTNEESDDSGSALKDLSEKYG